MSVATLGAAAERKSRPAGGASDQPTGHRTDIQGLRAIAVLLVVLDHAGVTWVAGGYVGVDVFFVISGFLITTLLVHEYRASGRISLRRFYARRAARLLPASTLVAVATLAAAWFWLSPLRIAEYGYDAIASAGYFVNVRHAVLTTDYFANPAPSPFQHFWSLAVEEQFYVGWPLLILAVFAVSRRRRVLPVVLALLCAGSLLYSAYELTRSAPWAYFGLPSRAWELGIGALVSLGAVRLADLRRGAAWVLGWAGLASVLTAAAVFDARTAFPGFAALLPVLGTAAIIAAGCAAPGGVGRILGVAPLQVVGRLSYGWYLWHWPLLVIVPSAVGRELGPLARLAVCLAGLLLALVTYHCVENPLRHCRALVARPIRGLAVGLGLSATTAAIAVVAMAQPPAVPLGAPVTDTRAVLRTAADPQADVRRLISAAEQARRVPHNVVPGLADVRHDMYKPQTDGCHLSLASGVRQPACAYGSPGAARTVVVLGDSHALQWFPAFEALANRNGWRLISLTRSACSPAAVSVRSTSLNRRYTECDPWREWSLGRIRELRPQLVVVASSTHYPRLLADRPADPQRMWSDAWTGLFATLQASAGRVLLLADTPWLSRDPLDCLTTYPTAIATCAEPTGTVLRDPRWRAGVRDAARRAGVAVVDPTPWLCAQRCPLVVGNVLVYRDSNHLTSVYAESLAPVLGRSLGRLP